MGHRIGESLVERISRDTPRFKKELDAVIFICENRTFAFFQSVFRWKKTGSTDIYTNSSRACASGTKVASSCHLKVQLRSAHALFLTFIVFVQIIWRCHSVDNSTEASEDIF